MKKILFILITSISILIGIKVNASTNDNLDVYMNYNLNQVMDWVYNSNSTEYLLNLVGDYDYKLINIQPLSSYNNGTYYIIDIYGSSSEEKLWCRYRTGYISGFLYNQPVEKQYQIKVWTSDYINFYNIDEHIISTINYYDTYWVNRTLSQDLTERGGGISNTTQDVFYTVYWNNMKLKTATGTNRTYSLYDLNSNFIGTYDIGDIIPDYVNLYHGAPNYLNGYKPLEITPENVNTMLSGLSQGSIFIPYDAYIQQHGTLGYFDVDVKYQPYTSIIEDIYLMPDGLYYKQDFDLSTHPESEYLAFYKYLYLEGEDTLSYTIYIPNDIYSSTISGVLDELNGKYDYTYNYQDSEGNIQQGSWTGQESEFLKTSPLLGDMFKNFSTNTFGLTAVVSAPLSLIAQITGGTCTGVTLPIPYTNSTITLPCMYETYQEVLGEFFNIYQMLTFGIIAYWVIVKFLNLVKDFKNPDHDEIEVLDL